MRRRHGIRAVGRSLRPERGAAPDVHELLRPETTWIFSPLLTYLGFALALVLLAHLVGQQRSPSSTIAWLLVILLLPYIGVPLYLMFGGRKMRRMAQRKQRVYAQPAPAPESGTPGRHCREAAQLLRHSARDGGQSHDAGRDRRGGLPAALSAPSTRPTRRSTSRPTSSAPTTWARALVERLARRAADGVEVRLLLDSVGSWRVNRRFLAPLTERRRPRRLLHAGAPHPVPGPGQPPQPPQDRRRRRPHRDHRRHEPGRRVHGSHARPEALARPLAGHQRPGRRSTWPRCSGPTGTSRPARTSARSRLPRFLHRPGGRRLPRPGRGQRSRRRGRPALRVAAVVAVHRDAADLGRDALLRPRRDARAGPGAGRAAGG